MAVDWDEAFATAPVDTSSVGGVAAASGKDEPRVYMGKKRVGKFRYDFSGRSTLGAPGTPGTGDVLGPPSGVVDYPLGVISKPKDKPDVRPQSEAENEWDEWDDEDRQKWADHLIEAGVIMEEDRWDYGLLQEKWYLMVGLAAGKYTNAKKEVDPWQMAVIYGGGDESGKTASQLGREILDEGPLQRRVSSTRSRNVDLTDPATAKALVNRALFQAMGREANDEEIQELTNVLNSAERRNPVISRTKSVGILRDDESGYDTTNRTRTTGGVDAGQVVMDEVADDRESKAYQAATTYWSALEQSLGTIGGNPV